MAEPHEPERFWLMPRDVPIGPFTVPEVHDRLTQGTITWQTKACQVGEGVWRQLIHTPGIGQALPTPTDTSIPVQPDLKVETTTTNHSHPVQTSLQNNGNNKRWETLLGVGILLVLVVFVGLAFYSIYEWVRPLRPIEVCQRMNEAKTLPEMKQYATARMYPFLESLAADQSPINPNDTFEFTSEIDGQVPDSKHVGFRGSFTIPEVGERMKMEGYFRLIRQDGWKVDDMIVSYVEGAAIPKPVSLVDDFQKSKEPSKPNVWTQPATPTKRLTQPETTATPKLPAANENFFTLLYKQIGPRGCGLILIGIIFCVGRQTFKASR